jgi:hypothetical protein
MAGPTSDPTTVSVWTRFVRDVGVPSVVALALVYFLTQVVRADLADLKTTLHDHATASERQVLLLRAICLISADTDSEKTMCEVGR